MRYHGPCILIVKLLWLQSRHARGEYLRRMFIEPGDWIRSITMSHEKLYQAKNVSAINSESYLTVLVSELMSSLDHVGSHVEFQAQIAELDLDPETGTALGLVFIEPVSHCVKHAFPDDGAGKLSLAVNEINDSTLGLSVADDAVGLSQMSNGISETP